jgi:hypothetical protein
MNRAERRAAKMPSHATKLRMAERIAVARMLEIIKEHPTASGEDVAKQFMKEEGLDNA